MALWKLQNSRGGTDVAGGYTTSLPTTTTVTCGGTPHTKTAWTQILSSTGSAPWYGFWVSFGNNGTSATDTSSLCDIGIGASSSEVALVTDYPTGYHSVTQTIPQQFFPLYVPASSRVAVRLQSAVASRAQTFSFIGNTGNSLIAEGEIYSRCTTYGANTGTSQGVSVTSGGSSNTFGSATELTSSTTSPVHAVQWAYQGAGATVMNGTNNRWSLWAGGSGSEVQISGDWFSGDSSSELCYRNFPGVANPSHGFSVPTGTRLSMKFASSTATTVRDFVLLAYSR